MRFKNFYVTDSCPAVAKTINGKGPFKVISLAESIVHTITNYKH